jgi:hypothetical protein
MLSLLLMGYREMRDVILDISRARKVRVMAQLAVGAFVSVLYDGSWYPAKIIRFDGDTIVVRRTQSTGTAPQIMRVDEDEIRLIAEKNFGTH